MKSGEVELKAWGVGIAPQAQLLFNGDVILKDQYVPVMGFFTNGTTAIGHRCEDCRLVVLQYGG